MWFNSSLLLNGSRLSSIKYTVGYAHTRKIDIDTAFDAYGIALLNCDSSVLFNSSQLPQLPALYFTGSAF
jgi:hypothetical protein